MLKLKTTRSSGIHSKVGLTNGLEIRGAPGSPSTAWKNIFRWKSPYKINRNHTKSTWLLYLNSTFWFTVTHIILIAVRVTLAIFNLPIPPQLKYSIRRLGDTMRDQKDVCKKSTNKNVWFYVTPGSHFTHFSFRISRQIDQALRHQVKSRQQLLWQHVVEGIDGDLSEGAFYGCFRK